MWKFLYIITLCYHFFQTKFLSIFSFRYIFFRRIRRDGRNRTMPVAFIHFTGDLQRTNRQTDETNGRQTCVDSSSMSHGFCHISIDVESSTYPPRPLLAVTPFVQLRLQIALFSLTQRVPLDLHSWWPRSFHRRRVCKPRKSVSPSLRSIVVVMFIVQEKM